MREVIALEALDLNNDPDMQAIESSMSLIDYAIESASFEIELGNEEFGTVLEAANAKKAATGDSWFKQLSRKVGAFVDKIISFFREQLDRIRTFFTGKKAKSDANAMKKKVAIGAGVAAGAVAVSAGLFFLAKKVKPNKVSDDMKLLDEGIEAAKNGTESYQEWKEKRIRDVKTTTRDMKTGLTTTTSTKQIAKDRKDFEQYKLTANEINAFMAAQVNSAQELNNFVKQAYAKIKQLPPDLQSEARKVLGNVIQVHSSKLQSAFSETKGGVKTKVELMDEADEENGEPF